MALRLVRKTSEEPNITNKDDTIMTRYAYGGHNGVVKAFGNECGYTAESGIFKVLSGRICLDGWEIDVGGEGWELNVSSIPSEYYYSVYAEINVESESVKLDSQYSLNGYPEIEKGDDLTTIQSGTARLLLYNVKVGQGTITEVLKRFQLLDYFYNHFYNLYFDLGFVLNETKNLINKNLKFEIFTNTNKNYIVETRFDNSESKTILLDMTFEDNRPTFWYAKISLISDALGKSYNTEISLIKKQIILKISKSSNWEDEYVTSVSFTQQENVIENGISKYKIWIKGN